MVRPGRIRSNIQNPAGRLIACAFRFFCNSRCFLPTSLIPRPQRVLSHKPAVSEWDVKMVG